MDELISSFESIDINKDWQEFSRLHNGIVGNNNFQSLYYYLHEIKKYYKNFNPSFSKNNEIKKRELFSIQKIKKDIGWQPIIDIEKGIKSFII